MIQIAIVVDDLRGVRPREILLPIRPALGKLVTRITGPTEGPGARFGDVKAGIGHLLVTFHGGCVNSQAAFSEENRLLDLGVPDGEGLGVLAEIAAFA